MEHATALVDHDATTPVPCSCVKLVAAGWKASCGSCGRNELGITMRPVAELEGGDRVLIYGTVEATVESVGDATKPGDRRPWVALRYVVDIGIRGLLVCPAAQLLAVVESDEAA